MHFLRNIVAGSLTLLASGALLPTSATELHIGGQWLTDQSGQNLIDPQSSGLTLRHGELIHLGDNSAALPMRNILLRINPQTGQLTAPPVKITIASQLLQNCFADLLTDYPDWESLTWDRQDDTTLVTVTEDSSGYKLSPECARRYADTHSTSYPTLLVKIKTDQALTQAEIVAVRPVQFPARAKVGNFSNDGIEGLAFDNDSNLYLALEKNQANAPMIFVTPYSAEFWSSEDFVRVADTGFKLPVPDANNHPINGLDYLPHPDNSHPGYLVAAARNDDQLWVIDISQRQPPFVQQLHFYAPTTVPPHVAKPTNTEASDNCPVYEKLRNTSIEGVAVAANQLYLVNDPWQSQYPKNIQCPANAVKFKQFSPLLFQLNTDPRWFIQPSANASKQR
ncbi:hypothetical protein SAMN06297280_0707 [Arsukibacterium tuosuense]|uniref:Phytase-like domain-containing protein n=1 Tax=Arsukibacterium tuosuense TaxID=1323745 RepID=A0A285I8E1_9GAMM|nr:hypothetical protein [Arsukibacterium tuosuense]SNY44224.1 hypothetical protein SAMN06297280_0707 [Arsukibacterium tuosuense]